MENRFQIKTLLKWKTLQSSEDLLWPDLQIFGFFPIQNFWSKTWGKHRNTLLASTTKFGLFKSNIQLILCTNNIYDTNTCHFDPSPFSGLQFTVHSCCAWADLFEIYTFWNYWVNSLSKCIHDRSFYVQSFSYSFCPSTSISHDTIFAPQCYDTAKWFCLEPKVCFACCPASIVPIHNFYAKVPDTDKIELYDFCVNVHLCWFSMPYIFER